MLETILLVIAMVISTMHMLDTLPKRACGHYNDKEFYIRFFIDVLLIIISIAGIITINAI